MALEAVIRSDFGDYKRGDHIKDAALVEKLREERPQDIRVIVVPDAPKE